MDPDFYETPTRFITIVSCIDAQCKELSQKHVSNNIYYYEINKKTGKGLKLKGETINIKENLNFSGYYFKNKDLNYDIDPMSETFCIYDKNSEIIEDEPMINLETK